MRIISFLIIYLIILYLVKISKENFGWSCNFTPNVDYYKEDWLLGGNEMAHAMSRDSIKPIYNF